MNRRLLDQVAEKVLRDSLRLKKGEHVTIETWNTGLPFAERVWVHARMAGAVPVLLFEDEDSFVEGYRKGTKETAGQMGEHEYALLSKTDAYVFIPGPVLGGSSKLTRDEFAASTRYNPSWYEAAKRAKLRAARMLFGYVGPELAKALRKPIHEIIDHQLRSTLVDFQEVRANAQKVSKLLRPGSTATLRAEGMTLRFELGEEGGLDAGIVRNKDAAAGENMVNIPPGYFGREIAHGTMSGTVRLHAPVPRLRTVADLRFEFEGGKLTSWKSTKSQDWLDSLVKSTPKDRRRLGAVIVGLNPALRRGYGQDRLVEGSVTLFGMFQAAARFADLDLDGTPLVANDVLVTTRSAMM